MMTERNESAAPGRQPSRTWYWMPILVFSIGMCSIALLLTVGRISEGQWINSLISFAVMDTEIHAASAHLHLEDAVREGEPGDEVLTELNEVLNLTDIILGGGETEHGLIPEALTDRELLRRIEDIRSTLESLKIQAVATLKVSAEGGNAEPLYEQFEANLLQLLDNSEKLDAYIGRASKEARQKAGTLFNGIIVVWAGIVLIASVGLFTRERRRRSAEAGQIRAHEQVLALAEELKEHREHLAGLVESRTTELSAANEQLRQEVARRSRIEEEVRRLNEDLEKKVEERTKQLVEAQEELVRREKFNILGQLAASVGNELRNPLGVMSNAVFFLKILLPEADATVNEYLGIIEKEIDKSTWIITDFLSFAKTRPPRFQPVSAGELVAECLGRCAIPDCVDLRQEVPENLLHMRVDPQQMEQVLLNLIMNAVQAMPAGGVITIRGRADDPGAVRLEIADTGEGITPENMKKLFQPLFTTKSRGIGLGLVVCRSLTEANGGRIEVESVAGRGTVFTLRLPATGGQS